MCGVYAYTGPHATQVTYHGLKRLDYRGYDSWGIVALLEKKLMLHKQIGIMPQKPVNELSHASQATMALGHTRWATHGGVTRQNAHPHLSSDGSFALVHNGVVENYIELKEEVLLGGAKLISETDTEVIVRLLEQNPEKDLSDKVLAVTRLLHGRNTFVILDTQGQLIAYKQGSPLILARRGQHYTLSSDVVSLSSDADEYNSIEDGYIAIIRPKDKPMIKDTEGNQTKLSWIPINAIYQPTRKTHESYLEQEILQTPHVWKQVSQIPEALVNKAAKMVSHAKQVYVLGSGSASAASDHLAYCLRMQGIRAHSLIGSDTHSYLSLITHQDVIIALSQSGETADVLEALKPILKTGAVLISFVNMPGSSLERLSNLFIPANAGPELSVMSTKVYSAQLMFGWLLAKAIQGKLDANIVAQDANILEKWLKSTSLHSSLGRLTKTVRKHQHVFLISSGTYQPIAKEGMIKLVEGAYIHAHAIGAGDFKHYAITLIEPGSLVLALGDANPKDLSQKPLHSAIHELRARGASVWTIGHGFAKSPTNISLPTSSSLSYLMSVVPLQLLSLRVAEAKGHNIDKPRNIAKSVTVI